MLAEAEVIEADLVGELDLGEEVGEAGGGGDGLMMEGIRDRGGEAVDADLHVGLMRVGRKRCSVAVGTLGRWRSGRWPAVCGAMGRRR